MSAANLDEQRMRAQELRYFGRVLAGQCHELANALNIAHQLCGLHADTLPRAGAGNTGAVEKLGALAERMEKQIARSSAIVRSLSRLAHSVDEPLAECDVRDIVERAMFFAARQARLRQTELRAVLPEGDVRFVNCSPFRLQQAIHAGIELLLDGTEGRAITAGVTFDPAGAVVTLASADPLPPHADAGQFAELAARVRALGGDVTPEGPGRIVFFIPYGHRDAALAEVSDVD